MTYRSLPIHVVVSCAVFCFSCMHKSSPSAGSAKKSTEEKQQSPPESDLHIHAGTADGAINDNSIFMVTGLTPEGQVRIPYGTASNIFYPRCLLTVGHLAQSPEALVAWQGSTYTPVSKGQAVEQRVLKGTDLYSDLGILWLQGRVGEQYFSTYAKLDLTKSIGLGHWDFENPPLLTRQSAGAPVDVKLIGYGASGAGDTGLGTRRTGAGKARWYSMASQLLPPPRPDGSMYFVEAVQPAGATAPQRGCKGDSGGPALYDGKIFGVIRGGLTQECGPHGPSALTGLDDTETAAGKSNWDWVHEYARRLCGKSMNFNKQGPGKVSGTVQPIDQTFAIAELGFNAAIQCAAGNPGDPTPSGWDDCWEKVSHEQTVTVTAIPDENATFSHWRGNGGGGCPCLSNPTCVIPYDAIGSYSEYTSIDGSYCTAVFQSNGGYGSPGGGYGSPGGGYGSPGGGYGSPGGGGM